MPNTYTPPPPDDLASVVRKFLHCLDLYGIDRGQGGEWHVHLTRFYIGHEDCGGGWLREMRRMVKEPEPVCTGDPCICRNGIGCVLNMDNW